MPLLWSYLLRSYFRVFLLSITCFVALLLVTRMKDIARFAALGSKFFSTILFILYQIPHILPIAIPISCLISSFLLFQRMSKTSELTALRASGISLKEIVAPILIAATMMAIINFYVTSELTTHAKQKSRIMLIEETTVNPLILLQRQKLLKIKETFIDLGLSENEKIAKNVLFIAKNKSTDHLSLLSAKEFSLNKKILTGSDVALISYIDSKEKNDFDTLIIENQAKMSTFAPSISKLMKKNPFRLNPSSLSFRLLLARAKFKNERFSITFNEISRRVSLGLTAFSFTFIGLTFGIEISRVSSKKGIFFAFFFSALIMLLYLIGKNMKNSAFLSFSTLILPHILLFLLGCKVLKNRSKGLA